jgi:tripartite ATP-independent transporter DctM subunit
MIAVMVLCFIVLVLLGVPLAFSLVLSSIIYMLTSGSLPLEVVPQRMMVGLDNFTFLAVPLFLLAGELMNFGGITTRLVNFVQNLIGRMPGGMGHVTIVTNMVMAEISGSALADAAATGSVLINAMDKAGYRKSFAAALVSASSTVGPIIPPSISFILYAIIANVSVGKMFIAGAIPGIVVGLSLMVLVAIIAKKQNFPRGERGSFKQIVRSFFRAFFALFMPVIILGGVFTGVFTATESAVVAVVYALIVSGVIYRELKWSQIPQIFLNTAKGTAVVMVIVSAATLFGWILSYSQIPHLLANTVTGLTNNPYLILFFINILLLMLGLFIEGGPLIVLLAPVLLPLVLKIGIDPVHFGVMMTLNSMIGMVMPPVGMLLFVTSSVAKIKLQTVYGEIVPFIVVLFIVLMMVTYIPQITLWLPNVFYK